MRIHQHYWVPIDNCGQSTPQDAKITRSPPFKHVLHMPRCDLVGLLGDGQLCGFVGAFEYAPKIVAYCEVHALKLCERLRVDQVLDRRVNVRVA